MMKSAARQYYGVLIGAAAILLFVLLRNWPDFTESVYGLGIYPVIRFVLDYTFGLLPFPVVYLFPVLLLFVIVRPFFHRNGWWPHLRYYLNFSGLMIGLFYFLWGFNYARHDLSQRISTNEAEISDAQLHQFGETTVSELNQLRSEHLLANLPGNKALEAHLRELVSHSVADYGIELSGRSRVRLVDPPGALRKFGITGIYFPFTGEALLEDAHPHPAKIFIMAHELAHSFGVTDEGEANLIAYIACLKSDQLLVQYAGHLAMWEYLNATFWRRKMEPSLLLKEDLTIFVQADLETLRADRRMYKEWIPEMGDVINDTYLKAQGIEEGTDAYLSLPMLYLQHGQSSAKD